MTRLAQPEASAGSQKWLQILINDAPHLLNRAIVASLSLGDAVAIDWRSPRRDDAYAEYRDAAFLDRLGVTPDRVPLGEFWPSRGPVWDGLGRTSRDDLFLIEAKAHIAELVSPASQAGEGSRKLIEQSLTATKRSLKVKNSYQWTDRFYQYTNRLAHLYFLRHLNRKSAYLIFVNFINATDVGGPTCREEWEGALRLLHAFLGIERHVLTPYVVDVFIDVKDLTRT
jgi:hypothetical protein